MIETNSDVFTKSAGFNLFVPKPVEPSELITAVAHLAETDTVV